MKGLYLTSVCLFVLTTQQIIYAQCPPPGFPQPGNSCPTAPILCENLDGYCATINNSNIVQNFPGCPGWQLNNDEWFAFFAGTTSITIQITPSNCSPGNQQGLQGGIYAGCGPPWTAVDLQCACTENPFILSGNNFVVGQIYWIVLDGCAGNVCDYTVDVLSGSTVGVPPDNPGPITGPPALCQGASGSYSLPAVVGATNYTWTLTPPGIGTVSGNGPNANVTLNNNASGTAQLCVTTSNLCYNNPTPSCFSIDVIPKPTATLSGSGILCAGANNPVNLTVSFTGEAPWEFIYRINGVPQPPIQTSDNPYILQVTQPGTYTLQSVTAVNGGCIGTVSGSATVTETNLTPSATVTNAACGLSNGAINLTPGGGNSPYTFIWSSGQTTEDINNIPAGTYTVTVTDEDGCTEALTVQVADGVITFNVNGAVTANTTCNGGNGSIDVNVNPAGSYTYNWSNGATTQDINNLTPGTYTVTVSAGGTCTQTASFTVPDDPNEPNLNATTTASTCDLSNGSVNLSVSGGVPPYTFSWSGGQTTEDLSNVAAGSYSVTVTGANGCTNTTSVTVTNNNPPIGISGAVSANTTCNGNGNGSIDVTINPAGSYTYTWSNGATTQDLTNLLPGTYSITVSAGGSCTQTANFTVPDNPNTPNVNLNPTASTCDLSNGSINLTVSGGVPPYTYSWSNGASTQNITGIPAGTYSVTVTGANGCTNTASSTVSNNNPPINVNANVIASTTCNGNGNGSIDVSVAPAGSYTYTWSNGATTQDLNNLLPGTYTVTVSAGGTCTQTASFTVPDNPNVPIINFNATPSSCDLNNGGIVLSVSGGVAPYTFQWSNGATTQNIANLQAGAYSVTVTGANGCSSAAAITVTNVNPPININSNINPNTSCTGGSSNGSIILTVTPPANYTFSWSNGATTQNLNGLPAGTYFVTVSAGGSCIQTAAFVVPNDPNAPDLSFTSVAATCGQSNGSINLTVFGGVPPYTYQWSNGQVTQDINNLPPDIYSVTVTGANGCTATEGVVIPNNMIPITLNGTVNPKTSCIVNNGSISLSLSPPNMSIMWSNGSTQPVLNNLAPGTYSVTVSAGGSCTETASFTVDNESQVPELVIDVTPTTCGLANGAIDLDVINGAPPFTYKWSIGPITQDLNNIPAGNYTVTVTSSLGCTTVSTIGVPNNDIAIDIFGIVSDNISCTTPNGYIDLNISPPGNYTYMWSNGKTTQEITNLAPGAYTVTVSWGSCSAIATFDVLNDANPPNLSVAGLPATCGQNNGSADASVSGGSSPYSYHWSNNASTQDLNNIAPGVYSLTVTDFFGCSSTASVTIANNNIALNINGIVSANTSCVTANGAVNISVAPAGNYSYLWSNNGVTEDLNNLAAGNYSVTVSAGGSCTATATFSVVNNTTDPQITPAVTPAICGASNGGIDLSISGANAPYTFIWSNNAATEDLVNILPGNYSVTVTAANGCTADTILNVPNNSSTFSLSGAATPLTNCVSNNGAVDLTVTPAGTYTYLWSNNATTEDISNLPAGTYTVSVTETGDCTASISFIVNDETTYPVTTQTVTPEICDLSNGGIDLIVSGGVMPYSFEWSGGQTGEDLVNVPGGSYSVTVTGANDCPVTASADVPENSISFSIGGTPAPNTSCVVNDGSIDLSLTPAGPGYTFLWSNNAVTEDLSGIGPGTYTVTVSAGGSCTNTATFTVSNNALSPTVSESITAAFCGQSSGGIDLTVSGGVAPYTFLWSNNAVSEDQNALISGSYSVTISSGNGCTVAESYAVPENVIIPTISGVTTASTSCISNNGGIALNVSPSSLTYTYVWSGGQTSQNLSNLAPGNYSVTVSGGGGCTAAATFTVGSDVGTVALNGSATDILCFGDNTGAINLTISGGTLPYVINWSPNIPGNPEDPANLPAGNYAVTVTDAMGCAASLNFTVSQPAAGLQLACKQTKNVSFPGIADGAGTVTITGGTAPYSIVWSPGGSQSNLLPGNFPLDNLSEGNYAVTVTDANGCTAICNFTIALIDCETAIGTMSATLLSSCDGGCLTGSYNPAGQFLDADDEFQYILHQGNGTVIINEIVRSEQPVFCFDPATMSYGVTYFISAVAGNNDGTGNVDLTDFCTAVAPGTPVVFREKPVAGIATPEPITCLASQVAVAGSSDLPASTFSWNTTDGQIVGSAAQQVIIAGKAGTYTLIVGANGCFDTTSVQVNDVRNQPQATILANPDDVLDCTINEIILAGTVEGTTAANTIWISNGVVYPGGTVLQVVTPGTYQFVILDTITFCSDTAVIYIDENLDYPPLFFNQPGLLTCANNAVTLSGGSPLPGIQYSWATVNGTDTTIIGSGSSISVSAPGVYYLIGTDPVNHCSNSLSGTVAADFAAPLADAGTPFSVECYGETAYLDGNGSSGAPGLTFLWTTVDGNLVAGITTPSPEINEPGTYILIVTNPGNGCTDSDEVVIAPKSPEATLIVNNPACFGGKGSILVEEVSGGKPPIRYSLDNGQQFTSQNLFTNLSPGTYTILILDANGCTTTVEAFIEEGNFVEIFLEPQVSVKLGDSYQINAQVNIPVSEIDTIIWSPQTGLSCGDCLDPVVTPLASMIYRIKVVDINGCEDTAPMLLAVDKQVDVYVPNIFSPDGDGHNDILTIYADPKGVTNIKSFQIFSRWGELVYEYYNFQPNNPAYGWNGKHRDQELNPAVFVWYAVLVFADGSEVLYKGDVTLKR